MKKKSVIVSILIAIGLCAAILVCIYFTPKSSANLPDLVSITQMDEAEVNKVLAGYYRNQLIEVWGEPDVSTVNEDIWKIGNDTSLLVSTNNKNKVVVCSISPQNEVDSNVPDGYVTDLPNEPTNQETGPADVDSSLGELVAVNKSDESKFTAEEWNEILLKVESGDILLFDDTREEAEYFSHR